MKFSEIRSFYNGKTVLLTGHTGFKGSWLAIWLAEMGAKVVGVALDPESLNNNFSLSRVEQKLTDIRADIRNGAHIRNIMKQYQPDIVFHLAAQALVRKSYDIPVETFETNVMGTINVLEAIREVDCVKAAVMITTDKCYENKELDYAYNEEDALGGYDPYSSSKGAVEIAIASWRRSFSMNVASARAGNVIGGGDWANDRIVPDCIRAIEADKTIEIRSPKAVRPWQHVLEPLGGYLLLAYRLYQEPMKYNQAWNFGPETESVATVWEVASRLVEAYGRGTLKDVSDLNHPHEANLLMLDIAKAKKELNWMPRLGLVDSLGFTADWYKRYQSEDVYALCVEQIKRYTDEL